MLAQPLNRAIRLSERACTRVKRRDASLGQHHLLKPFQLSPLLLSSCIDDHLTVFCRSLSTSTKTPQYTEPPPNRKPARSALAAASSRRAAAENKNASSGSRLVPSEQSTTEPVRRVAASCAAESFSLPTATRLLQAEGYTIDPNGTGSDAHVLHVRTSHINADQPTASSVHPRPQDLLSDDDGGDIFVFPSGTVVAWNVPSDVVEHVTQRLLLPAAEHPHLDRIEVEDMAYVASHGTKVSEVIGDTIYIASAANSPSQPHVFSHPAATTVPDQDRDAGPPINTALAATFTKIAFSSALARSTKLAVLEDLLSAYFKSTRDIPATLSAGSPLRLTRRSLLRKTGELLSIRAQLNLYSELTDSLPDLFWDSRHELGLEQCYDSLGVALDVGVRIKVLNERLDYASEIAAVLRETLSEKHSTGLEWLIIGLISIEVAFGIFHLWKEGREHGELVRVRHLLEQYLEREMATSATKPTSAD